MGMIPYHLKGRYILFEHEDYIAIEEIKDVFCSSPGTDEYKMITDIAEVYIVDDILIRTSKTIDGLFREGDRILLSTGEVYEVEDDVSELVKRLESSHILTLEEEGVLATDIDGDVIHRYDEIVYYNDGLRRGTVLNVIGKYIITDIGPTHCSNVYKIAVMDEYPDDDWADQCILGDPGVN